jgi:hypothetical protein
MSRFLQELVASMPMLQSMQADQGLEGLDRVEGYPVLMREFENGKAVSEVLFRSVEKRALPAATFEVPAGYAARRLDAEMGAGARDDQ